MVDNQHWLDRWKENRIGFHESEPNRLLCRHLPELGLEAGAKIFLPLCGKSVDMAWLAQQGFEVLGIELSRIAVDAFFDEQRLPAEVEDNRRFRVYRAEGITLLQGDFFELTAADLQGFALIYDRASLIAMESQDRPRYYRHMLSIGAAIPQTLLITLGYDQAEMAGPPFAVSDDEVAREYGPTHEVGLLERQDVLDESPRWRKAGLSALTESVFRLRRLDG